MIDPHPLTTKLCYKMSHLAAFMGLVGLVGMMLESLMELGG